MQWRHETNSTEMNLYFDGRHDQTSIGRGGDKTAEEHVAVMAEPGNKYVTHFMPVSGRAIDH